MIGVQTSQICTVELYGVVGARQTINPFSNRELCPPQLEQYGRLLTRLLVFTPNTGIRIPGGYRRKLIAKFLIIKAIGLSCFR